jgi:hypothetical protein
MNMCQRFKAQTSATTRRNATATSIFDLYNQGEFEAICDELRRPGVTKQQFAAMYANAIKSKEKGGFLHIDRMAAVAPYSANMVRPFPID